MEPMELNDILKLVVFFPLQCDQSLADEVKC